LSIIISQGVKFDESALKSIELEYKRNICSEIESKLIRGITKIICGFLYIPELAMNGAALNAVKEWESINNVSVNKIADMPIGKSLNALKEIFTIGKRIIKELATSPKKKSEDLIDISFERAFRFFLEYYNKNQR
jgi:hypothetical protein